MDNLPRIAARYHFSKPELTTFSMQISEKRNTLSSKSEKGKRRLSGWDNIIWRMKKKPNALFFPSFLPTPFNRRKETPRSAKVREILQFSFFRFDFVGGGAWVCLPPPPVQDGAEPHLWVLQGEASQEIRWLREGWLLPGGGAQARKMRGGTERGHGGEL